MRSVIVIGAGVVGMSCARDLARRGFAVTVLDRGLVGHGCSYGNAGWVTPCFAMPLAMPGMFFRSIGWLLDPTSPLYIQPRMSSELFRWLFHFVRSMNQRHLESSVRALVALSIRSLEEYQKLQEEDPSISLRRKGLLMVGQTAAGVGSAEAERILVSEYGVAGESLTPDQIRELEPALTGNLHGGVYFPDEAHVEPLATVRALARSAERMGAKIIEGAELYDFRFSGAGSEKRIESVRTTRGDFAADEVVLAAGTWSNRLASQLKLQIPILGGKGYALIVPPLQDRLQPAIPIMLVEKKIAVTPRDGSLRLAGTLELVKEDLSISVRRVDAIVRGAREFLSVPDPVTVQELWRGLRPCTPDGVPVIDRAQGYKNLVIAAGHQMLGLQSATGTGHWVGELLSSSNSRSGIESFDPSLRVFRSNRF